MKHHIFHDDYCQWRDVVDYLKEENTSDDNDSLTPTDEQDLWEQPKEQPKQISLQEVILLNQTKKVGSPTKKSIKKNRVQKPQTISLIVDNKLKENDKRCTISELVHEWIFILQFMDIADLLNVMITSRQIYNSITSNAILWNFVLERHFVASRMSFVFPKDKLHFEKKNLTTLFDALQHVTARGYFNFVKYAYKLSLNLYYVASSIHIMPFAYNEKGLKHFTVDKDFNRAEEAFNAALPYLERYETNPSKFFIAESRKSFIIRTHLFQTQMIRYYQYHLNGNSEEKTKLMDKMRSLLCSMDDKNLHWFGYWICRAQLLFAEHQFNIHHLCANTQSLEKLLYILLKTGHSPFVRVCEKSISPGLYFGYLRLLLDTMTLKKGDGHIPFDILFNLNSRDNNLKTPSFGTLFSNYLYCGTQDAVIDKGSKHRCIKCKSFLMYLDCSCSTLRLNISLSPKDEFFKTKTEEQ